MWRCAGPVVVVVRVLDKFQNEVGLLGIDVVRSSVSKISRDVELHHLYKLPKVIRAAKQ